MSLLKKEIGLFALCLIIAFSALTDIRHDHGIKDIPVISKGWYPGAVTLSSPSHASPLLVSGDDWPGVIRALNDLRDDLASVTGRVNEIYTDSVPGTREAVIIGTVGRSSLIGKLISENKIDIRGIEGKWESYLITTVNNPLPGIRRALVIAGSDKRGTIYGVYQLSVESGVSPWHWWDDVPPQKNERLFARSCCKIYGEPSVKYRGIFLNDEYPSLTKWVEFRYGSASVSDDPPVPAGVANYGREFYSRIFELLLRMKANYLWPAMWNNAFNEDDTLNAKLADEFGIVMGTSHQEPMMRAQKEWDRRYLTSLGSWSWTHHADTLKKFWRNGILRNRDFESIITVGLRGADDTEMGPGGPEANIGKLEKIVETQRNLISEVIKPDLADLPQLWCLYKEVLDYYNAGLRVPDDITLLWTDDNWGNIRRLPLKDELRRKGGAGVYYHFDYHGGPRSYQWINTNTLSGIWDQMTLAKDYGADRIWIVNVGHLRGYEVPLEFFLSMAWDAGKYDAARTGDFAVSMARRDFGSRYAEEIADILMRYSKLNARRKPELLSPSTYSQVNYNEAERVSEEYRALVRRATEIKNNLPREMQDAYYHLVYFPVVACSTLNDLYAAAGKNALYAAQERSLTGAMADSVETLFRRDTTLMGYYNRSYAGGRWNHFMDQAHLGYTGWADPPVNSLRAIELKRPEIPDKQLPGVAVEGSAESWPGSLTQAELPCFDIFNRETHYFEIFNRGKQPFACTITSDRPWIMPDISGDTIADQRRVTVGIDWKKIPEGNQKGTITVSGAGTEVTIGVTAFAPGYPERKTLSGFVEADGYISIEAEHFTSKRDFEERSWVTVKDYGRTLSAMRATGIPYADPAVPGINSPSLEYRIYFFSEGDFKTLLYTAPSLNFLPGRDIKVAISVDDGAAKTVMVVPGDFNAQNFNREWEESVMNDIRVVEETISVEGKGYHTLKIWMVDQGVKLEKLVIDTGGLRESYLGPPESYYGGGK